jgi:hypothetical protein
MYRWVPMDRWVDGGLEPWPPERAHDELVRRWLRAFGPGTQRDIGWWAGWTVARTKATLKRLGAVEVSMGDDRTGYVLPDDLEPTRRPDPWVALLPALDTTTMAWKDREFYLGEHATALFDRNGNAGPTIWVDGRVVGGWGQRPNAEVVTRLFEDVGREAAAAIDAEADRVARFVDGQRVTPRFRTPLEAELASA